MTKKETQALKEVITYVNRNWQSAKQVGETSPRKEYYDGQEIAYCSVLDVLERQFGKIATDIWHSLYDKEGN